VTKDFSNDAESSDLTSQEKCKFENVKQVFYIVTIFCNISDT